jgi:betaine lipid synthase
MLEPHISLSPSLIGWTLASLSFSLLTLGLLPILRTPLLFVYNCFLKPFLYSSKTTDQRDHLDEFYEGQAEVYDSTRTHLLKGRETMLQLMASHLKAQRLPVIRPGRASQPKIWVDIGGGTGWNIEKM